MSDRFQDSTLSDSAPERVASHRGQLLDRQRPAQCARGPLCVHSTELTTSPPLERRAYGERGRAGAWCIEHSRAKALGGTDHINNLYPSCFNCNERKGRHFTRRAFRRKVAGERTELRNLRGEVTIARLKLYVPIAALAGFLVGPAIAKALGLTLPALVCALIAAAAGALLALGQDP